MSIIHEEKGIGVITETEVVLKNGQKISLYEIGYAKYKSRSVAYWCPNLIILTMMIVTSVHAQLVCIILMSVLFIHIDIAPYGTLVIYNKRGGQIASQGISLCCDGSSERFLEAINKHTK